MRNADSPSMPIIDDEISTHEKEIHLGLTKREMFAMHAMASWINHHGSAGGYGFSEKEAAKNAVECADALLEELAK